MLNKNRAAIGLIAVVAGVALIGTSGAAFVLGWALWAVGLAALLTALPEAGENKRRPAVVTALPSAGNVGDRQAA
jgi:hypothetical protein